MLHPLHEPSPFLKSDIGISRCHLMFWWEHEGRAFFLELSSYHHASAALSSDVPVVGYYLEKRKQLKGDQANQFQAAGYSARCLSPAFSSDTETRSLLIVSRWLFDATMEDRLSHHLELNNHIPFPKEEEIKDTGPHILWTWKFFEIHIFSSSKEKV